MQNLEFLELIKPTVSEENLGREGRGNIKENIAENVTERKLELSRRRNSAERDIRESLALSKLINRNTKGGEDREVGIASHAGTESVRRQTKGVRGLADDAEETPLSRASTSECSVDDVTRWTVKRDKRQARHSRRYKYYMWTMLTSVFKLTLRMQARLKILITACILSMVSLVPTLMNKERRHSKYKA